MSKKFLTAGNLLRDSFRLADKIFEDGFRPDFIVGVWRGGAPVAIAIHEFYEYKGVETDHFSIRTSSYTGINQQAKEVKIYGLKYLLENIDASHSMLIVDDVFDSGKSIDALMIEIQKMAGENIPYDIRIACPWYKPGNRQVDLVPDYYLHETEEWLVFPHELQGLTEDEIIQGKTDVADIPEVFKK